MNRSAASAGRPSPAQQALLDELHAELPRRPWWLLVSRTDMDFWTCPGPGLLMRYDHTSWRSQLPPCSKPDCQCTVYALTPAQARAHEKRNPLY
jgi:hypothetical protein